MARCLATIAVLTAMAAGSAAWAGSEVDVRITPGRATISNASLTIEISLNNNRARTLFVRNRRAAKTLSIDGDDFTLEFASGRRVRASDFHLESAKAEIPGPAAKRIAIALRLDDLRVLMITELDAEEWWATRWLEIEGGRERLEGISLAHWRWPAAMGPSGPGNVFGGLGLPSGFGQVVYAQDLFLAIAHPGAANFATGGFISCQIPSYADPSTGKSVSTRKLVIGAGKPGAARHAFLQYISTSRAVPSRMLFLVNDWYWKDKSKPVKAIEALARVKEETGVPIDSFTLDDGWDFDWDEQAGIWGRLNRQRFPGGWESLEAAARPANLGISLWFGPIGGYDYRKKRIEFAKQAGFELNKDKLCLAGTRYRTHVIESFANWAARGMDYIKVDGFWPDCPEATHGHPAGTAGAIIAQMDSLIDVFYQWRKAKPDLLIGYTSGSNPSPFWLQHADYIWRGGADDSHAGVGEPFDRHNTYIDTCLQALRVTEVPVSAFVTFDIVQDRIAGNRDDVFEKGVWWLAARTSLHHDWYIQASDLNTYRWKVLARAGRWAKSHEQAFQYGRMVGGNPSQGEIYGFSAFEGGRGTLALRNPSAETRELRGTLVSLLDLPKDARSGSFRLHHVFGEAQQLEGVHRARAAFNVVLPPLAVTILELGVDQSKENGPRITQTARTY